MTGKEVKNFIKTHCDIEYTIIIVDNDKRKVSVNDLNDDDLYEFEKIDEFLVGSGMILAYFSIKNK